MPFSQASRLLLRAFAALVPALTAMPSGADTAKRYFDSNCAMCHTVSPDQRSLMGPGLFNVLGRKIGGVPGFGYSAALAKLGAPNQVWTPAELDRFLRDPSAFAPGTSMPISVPDKAQRAAVLSYLAAQTGQARPSAAVAPAAAASDTRGSWTEDAPGRIHELKAADLDKPYATESASNGPRTVPRPEGMLPAVPDGFKVNLWAKDPDRGRVMVKAPNGDIFISSTPKRLVKVFRSANGETATEVSPLLRAWTAPSAWPSGPLAPTRSTSTWPSSTPSSATRTRTATWWPRPSPRSSCPG